MNYDLAKPDKYLHEQFYTSEKLGELMLQSLETFNWTSRSIEVVDLCMGEGRLLESVARRSPQARLYGSDIDVRNVLKVSQSNLLNIDAHHLDATTKDIKNAFDSSQFDLVVGNPPFKLVPMTEFITSVCSKINLYPEGNYIEAEVFFLLYGISLLKEGGTLAYILPDGVLNKVSLKPLRKYLVDNFTIESITEIAPKSFEGTEARTHFIILKNQMPLHDLVKVKSYSFKTVMISVDEFINRGDYSYYRKATALKTRTLGSTGAILIRGRTSKRKLLELDVKNYIHTSSISHSGTRLESFDSANDAVIATTGDIVIARVGTRCLGKFGVVSKGEFYVSDCIIIIRCNDDYVKESILGTLSSSFGKNWIQSISKGVGARHITVNDLHNFPIIENKDEH